MVLAEGNLTVGGSVMFDGFLGTDGCIDNVKTQAEQMLKDAPNGSLVLFVARDHTSDLCYAFKDRKGAVRSFGCRQSLVFEVGRVQHKHE
jgi:hypothetical protein